MANRRRLVVEIAGDASGAQRAFDRSERAATSWGSKLSSVAKGAAFGLAGVAAAAGVTAVALGVDMVRAAEESQKVTRQTNAVIESMGDVAGISAEGVAELAEQLSLKAGIDDELIQSGANVLLTFRNVRDEVGAGNDVFTRATTAALDMSVALGQDMQSSVTQLGKALNDPIAGISALSRVGVQFTDDQKAVIQALVDSGNTLAAQKIILDEVEAQFTGSAEAQATATDKLTVAFGNLQEEIGGKLLPWVTRFSDWVIAEGLPNAQKFWQDFEQNMIPKIRTAAAAVGQHFLPALKLLGAVYVELGGKIKPLLESLGRLLTAITGNEDGASDLTQGMKVLGIIMAGALGPPIAVGGALLFVATQATAAANAVGALIRQVQRMREQMPQGLGFGFFGGLAGVALDFFGAEGGVVSARGIERFGGGGIAGHGRDTVPAMLAPREMVLTERDQQNLLGMIAEGPTGRGGGGGDVYYIDVSMAGAIVASSREAQEWVTEALNKALRTRAGVNIKQSALLGH